MTNEQKQRTLSANHSKGILLTVQLSVKVVLTASPGLPPQQLLASNRLDTLINVLSLMRTPQTVRWQSVDFVAKNTT